MAVVLRDDVEEYVHKARRAVSRRWQQFPDARRFLEDHYADVWEQISRCRMSYRTQEDEDDPQLVKVTPHMCNVQPWCLECSAWQQWRRLQRKLKRFRRCTPDGEQPRYIHAVVTAMVVEGRPGMWGERASRDHAGFADKVYRAFRRVHGDGIGVVMSYQDFGERPFLKVHPHIDMTLNGWMLQGDRAVETPEFDLTDGGRLAFNAHLREEMAAYAPESDTIRFWLGRWKRGEGEYRRILDYQLREMVNLRNVRYPSSGNVVGWWDYHEQVIHEMPVRTWKLGTYDYAARLGVWDGTSGEKLHFDDGHMHGNAWRRTAKLMGSKPDPHDEDCACNQCRNWRRIFMEDLRRDPPPTLEQLDDL